MKRFSPVRLRGIGLILATLLVFALPPRAYAHPHAWLDLRTTVKLDDKGRMTALIVDWTFDEFYSAFVLEGIDRNGTNLQAALDATTEENLKNLSEYNYFTVIRAAGVEQAFGTAVPRGSGIKEDRYWMRFEVPLKTPIDPVMQQIDYAVFDPTYYIEVVYAETGLRVGFESASTANCSAAIIAPTPSEDMLAFAASLDQTESGGASLGEHFAEVTRLTCN